MNFDFKTMSQDKKIKLGILIGMIVTYFLPWYKTPQDDMSPFLFFVYIPYYPIFIGLIASVIGLFLVLKDDVKFSLFVAAACLFSAANFYLILIPYEHLMFDFIKQVGIAEWQKLLGYGFYINAALSLGFLLIALKEKGILDKLTNKTAPAVNTGEAAPVQNVTPVTPKVKKPPIKISKTTKIIAVVVILLAAAGGGYYKFIYTPEYQAFDFLKQINAQFELEGAPIENEKNLSVMGQSVNIISSYDKEWNNKMQKENPRLILKNCFVERIEKMEKAKDTLTYSEIDKSKPQLLYQIYLTPYKKLENGKIVWFGEGSFDEYTAPADLRDKDMVGKWEIIINVYDEKLIKNSDILPVANLSEDFKSLGLCKDCKLVNKYYLSDLSAKVGFKDYISVSNNYFGSSTTVEFDLIEMVEVKDVVSPQRSKMAELFDIDYKCVQINNVGEDLSIAFYTDTARSQCIKQIKPVQGEFEGNGVRGSFQGKQSYKGELMYGLPSGNGVQIWSNNYGEFESRIEGTFANGNAHGKCKQTFRDSTTYVGDFVNGLSSGKGIQTYADSSRYEGDYLDDNLSGKGIFTWPSGNIYEGDWVDNQRTGKGVFIYADGEKYEGDWVDNKETGKGVYTWANGEKYEGDFVDGKISGKGIKYAADGSVIWEH